MISYWLDAATITLSSFAAAALATSVLVGLAAPVLARRAARYAPAARATLLFQLRVLPAAFARGLRARHRAADLSWCSSRATTARKPSRAR